jgi:hypothetical protein
MIVWPKALKALRAQAEHLNTRLRRMERVAAGDASRLDWNTFPDERLYLEGRTDAYDEVLQIIDGARREPPPLLEVVVELARQGLDVEAIAARCGSTVAEVAESLARYAAATEGGANGSE